MRLLPTKLEGLLLFDLDVHADERGSFREAVQIEKMEQLGLPGFSPVQQNVSHNRYAVLRGIHAEPWNKMIHVAYGEVFAALVDLRTESSTFGECELVALDPSKSIFVPRSFGNSFQVLSDVAVYNYLVDEHWQPGPPYPAVAYDDPELAIPWPIDPSRAVISDKDRANPSLAEFRRKGP